LQIYGTKDGFAPPDPTAESAGAAADDGDNIDSAATDTPAEAYSEEIPTVESLLEGLEISEGEGSHKKDEKGDDNGSAPSSSGSNSNNTSTTSSEGGSGGSGDATPPRPFLGRPGLHTATTAILQGEGGELLIKDAVSGQTKSIGHRSQRRYYQQHFPAADKRDSVLAAQRERLLIM